MGWPLSRKEQANHPDKPSPCHIQIKKRSEIGIVTDTQGVSLYLICRYPAKDKAENFTQKSAHVE
jgi:hypothetical protein